MTSNRLSKMIRLLSALLLTFGLLAGTVLAQSQEVDTSKVREPEPIEKSFGEHLLSVPVYLLQMPVWTVEFIAEFLVDEVYADVVAQVLAKILTAEYRAWGMYPIVGYNSDAGFKFGGSFNSDGVFSEGERLRARAYYSSNEYQAYRIRYNAPNLLSAHRGVTFETAYNRRTRESFYGIGPDSREADEVNFGEEEFRIRGGGLWLLSKGWQLEATAGYQSTNLMDGDDPGLAGDLDSIRVKLGLSDAEMRPTRFVALRLALLHDNRNNRVRTTRGGYHELSLGQHIGVGRTEGDNFWQLRLDIRRFVELFHKRTLAFRLVVQQLEPAGDDSDVPFYLRSGLGGFETLRGFRTRRLVDNDFLLAQVEYRWPILSLMDAFISFDEGRVFNDIAEQFSFQDWRYSVGGGIRVLGTNDVTASMMLATSDEGPRFYLEFSETF